MLHQGHDTVRHEPGGSDHLAGPGDLVDLDHASRRRDLQTPTGLRRDHLEILGAVAGVHGDLDAVPSHGSNPTSACPSDSWRTARSGISPCARLLTGETPYLPERRPHARPAPTGSPGTRRASNRRPAPTRSGGCTPWSGGSARRPFVAPPPGPDAKGAGRPGR